MPILYDSKRLLPVSSINIEKEYVRGEGGTFRRVQYVVTVNGNLVALKGSPQSDGTFWSGSGEPPDESLSVAADFDNRLAILRNKKGALDALFSTRGKLFEIQPFDGTTSVRFIPRVRNINYTQGNPQIDWLEKIPYTIIMETDQIDFGSFILNANEEQLDNDCDESWAVEPNDDKNRSYKVVHTLTANAHDEYDPAGTGDLLRRGWLVAKEDKVVPNMGFTVEIDEVPGNDQLISAITNVGDLSGFSVYNYVKTENIDEPAGRYSIIETWILYDGGDYIEDYNVSIRTAAETGAISVGVDGTITGLSTTPPPGIGDKFTNAEAAWTTIEPLLITRAQTYSGETLNATVINKTVGKNPINGVITYNYEYSNRPTATITGALSESVTINDTLPVPVIAKHVCVLRTIGPVLQDIGTITESHRTITIDVQMPSKTTTFTPTEPDVLDIILDNVPSADWEGPYLEKNEKSWSPQTGRYSRTVSWIWV